MEKVYMRFPPALILFFLAPAIAELLSGSAPPAEFFNPVRITALILLVLLARKIRIVEMRKV